MKFYVFGMHIALIDSEINTKLIDDFDFVFDCKHECMF